MKKLIAVATIILSLSSYAYANTLSTENKKFVESVIKKQFPKAKYNKADQDWSVNDDLDIKIYYNFDEITTPNGKVGLLAINDYMGASGPANTNLYELSYSGNKNVQFHKHIEDDDNRTSAGVVKLGKQKLGFAIDNVEISGSSGDSMSKGIYYSVNGKYKHLEGCLTRAYRGVEVELECELKIRTDMPESNGFYPIEFKYKLERDQVAEFDADKEPKGWDFAGGGFYRKPMGKRQGSVIAKFDSSKQAYVLPTNFVKALNAKQDSYSLAYLGLWDYFKK